MVERERSESRFRYSLQEAAHNFFATGFYAPNRDGRLILQDLRLRKSSSSEMLAVFTHQAKIEEFATIVMEGNPILEEWGEIETRLALATAAERNIFNARMQLKKGTARTVRLTKEARNNIRKQIAHLKRLSEELLPDEVGTPSPWM